MHMEQPDWKKSLDPLTHREEVRVTVEVTLRRLEGETEPYT